jgi:hypothetical protein
MNSMLFDLIGCILAVGTATNSKHSLLLGNVLLWIVRPLIALKINEIAG